MYNRASCDVAGQPFDPRRTLLAWNGKNWGSVDVPDFKADEDPAGGMGPFIMNPEGIARFFAKAGMAEGPFPEHYEPFDTPLRSNPLSPGQALTLNNPAARVFASDRAQIGSPDEFPHVATTYRLTEHFHFWT
ncbi:formate dehydrogenase, partial [Rhodoblastus acidophilus]|nr:formate dehydrogenase [Candidatus Rhodoblastus alkanivorans]